MSTDKLKPNSDGADLLHPTRSKSSQEQRWLERTVQGPARNDFHAGSQQPLERPWWPSTLSGVGAARWWNTGVQLQPGDCLKLHENILSLNNESLDPSVTRQRHRTPFLMWLILRQLVHTYTHTHGCYLIQSLHLTHVYTHTLANKQSQMCEELLEWKWHQLVTLKRIDERVEECNYGRQPWKIRTQSSGYPWNAMHCHLVDEWQNNRQFRL